MKSHISKITIFLLIIICAWQGKNLNTWGKNKIIQNDVISYYAYLPAAIIFNDLEFEFIKTLPEDFEGTIWLQTTPIGKPILRMTMGLAILWSPFFLAAHGAAHLLGESTLGYSWPYSLSIFIAALSYLFIGLFYIRKILLRYFSDLTTAITLLLIVLATNLMFYVVSEPGMSHVFSFGLIAMFINYSLQWVKKPSLKYTLLLGLLAGLIVLIRPVNILILLFPALIGVFSITDFKNRILENWSWIIIAGIAAFMVLVPQFLYWKSQSGHFLFNSYMDSGKFYFLKPNIVNGLISYRKGWFLYTPIMGFAILGFFWIKRYTADLILPLVVFVVLNIYVVYSWWCWWYGGCFGSRPMIDMYGIMALPLAALLQKTFDNKIWAKSIATVFLLAIIGLNQFQMKQYRTSLLHWDSMTKEAYWGIFGKKTWPEGYDKMIKVPDYEKALNGEKEY
jgi:4-amino-4-deoxy-L-arabinose transferase-like glycosyltransferase